jgi:hypothetical protein
MFKILKLTLAIFLILLTMTACLKQEKITKEVSEEVYISKKIEEAVSEELEQDQPIEYLHPVTTFQKYDHVLYENEFGTFRIIGETNLNSNNLLATRFEGEMATEWKENSEDFSLLEVKATYDNGSTFEGNLGKADTIFSTYKDDEGNTVVIYYLGEIENHIKLVSLEYRLIGNNQYQSIVLSNPNETIDLLGVQKLSDFTSKSNITLEDHRKVVEITKYSFSEGMMLEVEGHVIFKEKVLAYNGTPTLMVPSKNIIVQSYYSQSTDFNAKQIYDFNISFMLNQTLTTQDTLAELYLYGLGTTISLQKEPIDLPKSKSLSSHFFNFYNVSKSSISGETDLKGVVNHQSVVYNLREQFLNDVNANTIPNRLIYAGYFEVGGLFETITFDAKLSNILNQTNIHLLDDKNETTKVLFYSMENHEDILQKYLDEAHKHTNGNDIEPLDKVKLKNLKLLKDISLTREKPEKSKIKLDVPNTHYIGVFIDAPAYSNNKETEQISHNLLLTNSKMYYKK